jgi:N-acetylmuramoyl-L-alanine amidase
LSYEDNQQEDEQPAELPASVVFMEMMRQAAADLQRGSAPAETLPGQPDAADALAGIGSPHGPSGLTDEEIRHAAAMEAQRVRRIQRRKTRRRRRTVGMLAGLVRAFLVVFVSGGLIATILSWWTSPQSFPVALRIELGQINPTSVPVVAPTLVPTPNYARRIGIIAGHNGPENDPGAVCVDENGVEFLTEAEINYSVAYLIWQDLFDRGYNVELLDEWDPRLEGYQADALVSIHANSCSSEYLDLEGNPVSGFLVGHAEARPPQGPDALLVECIAAHYSQETQLDRRYDLPLDMADYHAFREISLTTPGAIIEIGFMFGDRELITGRADRVSKGIIDGILCYLNDGDDPLLYVTPTPELPDAFATDTPTPAGDDA